MGWQMQKGGEWESECRKERMGREDLEGECGKEENE